MTISYSMRAWLGLLGACLAGSGCVDGPGEPSGSSSGSEETSAGASTQGPTSSESETTQGPASSESESGADESESGADESESGADESESGADESESTGDESESGADESETSGGETTGEDPTDTGGGEPLALIAAELSDDYGTLTLSFSEPVDTVADVDPADFRISYAWTYSVEYEIVYEMSYYRDPSEQLAGPLLELLSVDNGPLPNQISFEVDPALTPEMCQLPIDYVENQPFWVEADSALFTHYSPGVEPVLSEGGEALAAIGPDWVLTTEQDWLLVDEFGFPNLDPQIPIVCPP